MAQTTLLVDLQTYLAGNDETRLRGLVEREHEADLASEIGAFRPDDAARIIRLMPAEKQGTVFGYLPLELQTGIAGKLSRQELAILVAAMPHDERADLYKRLPPLEREALLPALAQAEREDIRKLAAYPEGTAGSVMTSGYATLPRSVTVAEAIEKLRQEAPDAETIYQAYVVDIERRLLGVVSLRDLIVAGAGVKVADLMKRDVVSGRVDEPAEAIAKRIAEYDLLALPITDAEGRLVGIVTQDDAMDIASEDASELMYRKAGMTDAFHVQDHIRSEKLTKGSIWYPIRVRLLFLLVTLAGGLAVGTLIDAFEDVLMAVVAVAVFIPLIMDMGGNVGTQSTTIFARGFALGHIQLERFKAYFLREASVGLVMGVVIGVTAGVIAYYWQGVPNGVPELGIAVGVALFTTVTLACMLGFLLPYAMVKVGIDHAPGADPFITTIKDFSGLAVYFLLVAWLLGLEI